jgi:hypothetical protein
MSAVRGAAIVVVAAALFVAPAQATLSADDKRALVQIALQWAIDGGIADVKLIKDPKKIFVLNVNLPPRTQPEIPDRKVEVQSLALIQAVADTRGDLLYFRIGPFTEKDQHAIVPIALIWAVSVKSTEHHLSGGGATLEFEKRDGKWQQLPVTNRWAS